MQHGNFKIFLLKQHYFTLLKVCAGTSVGFSSNRKDYEKWRSIYSNCIYVDGNVEINMFDTYSEDDVLSEYALKTNYTFEYDFSFLDDIREITGYLLIHGNINLKTLRFKNLSLIRGKSLLYNSTFSLYIENNVMLETLDLGNLREIQRGGIYVQNNPRLCHMNEVNWLDLLPNKLDNVIRIEDNADPLRCDKCTPTCCNGTSSECGCWFPNGCQKCKLFEIVILKVKKKFTKYQILALKLSICGILLFYITYLINMNIIYFYLSDNLFSY